MANIRDFAVAEVLTAPSPATSGTSLVLKSGQGSDMPTTTPFYLTAFPKNTIPTKANSEVILVTARSSDTLTITRAQKGTTAQSIAADWIVTNSLYADDIISGGLVLDEALSGTVNGSNTVFTTSAAFTSIDVRVNGVAQHIGSGNDFTKTGDNQITFTYAPSTGSVITASYLVGGQVLVNSYNSFIAKEAVTGSVNGSNTQFTTARPYIGGTLQVYVNGLAQGHTYITETTPASGIFNLDTAPLTGDNITVSYQFAPGSNANADTVDGYHANATPTANQIPVLDANARISALLLGNVYTASAYASTNQSVTAATFNKMQLNTENYDLNNNFDNATNYRYTVPATGYYRVNGASSTGASVTSWIASIYKNGSEFRRGAKGGTTGGFGSQVYDKLYLTAGDYLELYTYSSSSTTIEGGAMFTYMTIEWAHA